MTTKWFYSRNGRRCGPGTAVGLKALAATGKLLPTDLVWTEGMAAWQPASKVKGLFPPAATTPLPLPPTCPAAAPPDFVAAAKGLFGAATVTAKQLADKGATAAAVTAKRLEDKGAATATAVPAKGPDRTVPVRARSFTGQRLIGVLALGGALAVCFFVLVVCAGVFSLAGKIGQGAKLAGQTSQETSLVGRFGGTKWQANGVELHLNSDRTAALVERIRMNGTWKQSNMSEVDIEVNFTDAGNTTIYLKEVSGENKLVGVIVLRPSKEASKKGYQDLKIPVILTKVD